MKMSLRMLTAGAAALVLCLAACSQQPRSGGSGGGAELVLLSGGPVVDYDWTMEAMNGGEISLADYRGKVLFLNVWATWCPPCVAEMPSIEKLYRELSPEGLEFLMVSVDDDTRDVTRFMDKNSYTFPTAMWIEEGPSALESEFIPATFVIGSDGRVLLRHIGEHDWASPKTIALLRQVLKDQG